MKFFIQLSVLFLMACGSSGGLSAEQLTTAKDLVHPLQPKDKARTALVEALGEPMGEDETSSWWQTSGNDCKRLKLTWMGSVMGSASVEDC